MKQESQYRIRGFRMTDDLYNAAQRKARRVDLTVTQVVRHLLNDWLGDEKPEYTQEEGTK